MQFQQKFPTHIFLVTTCFGQQSTTVSIQEELELLFKHKRSNKNNTTSKGQKEGSSTITFSLLLLLLLLLFNYYIFTSLPPPKKNTESEKSLLGKAHYQVDLQKQQMPHR